jgi:hypothetical protein
MCVGGRPSRGRAGSCAAPGHTAQQGGGHRRYVPALAPATAGQALEPQPIDQPRPARPEPNPDPAPAPPHAPRPQVQRIDALKAATLGNLVLACMGLEDYSGAVAACDKALQ